MFDTTGTKSTDTGGEGNSSKTASRRRFLRGAIAGVATVSTIGTKTTAATRRYRVRRLRTDTPGQSAIEDIELIHDRRLFGEDVFCVVVTLTDYAMRYDRQRLAVSAAENWAWNWNEPVIDRSTGGEGTRRLLSDIEMPVFQTPRAMEPIAIKAWTETDPGRGDWLSQERTVVEPAGAGES